MNHVVIIQSNISFLSLFLHRLPYSAKKDFYYHFVVDDRWNCDLIDKVYSKLLQFTDIKSEVKSGKHIIDECQKILNLTGDSYQFMKNYRISLKILAPLYFSSFFEKFLVMDDDIVIIKDPKPFFEHSATIQSLGFGRYGEEDVYFKEYNCIFDSNITTEQWNKRNSNGVVMIESKLWSDWKDILFKTFTSSILLQLYKKYEVKQFKYRACKLFFVDLHLFCFKSILLNADVTCGDEVQAWLTKKLPEIKQLHRRKRKWPIFIHYAAGKQKEQYVELLMSKELDNIFKKENNEL